MQAERDVSPAADVLLLSTSHVVVLFVTAQHGCKREFNKL